MKIQTPIRYILFDACNTLMHKPTLWAKITGVLENNGHTVELLELQQKHKLLSECIHFPDRTSKDFYKDFNAELLYAIGIIPTELLLEQIFEACSYLPWEAYEDTAILTELNTTVGVLSNFNSTLKTKLDDLVGDIFQDVLISEVIGLSKPDVNFYRKAIEMIGLPPEEILYIGDSLKLDVKPALELGLQPFLIDREGVFKGYKNRLDSLMQLKDMGLC